VSTNRDTVKEVLRSAFERIKRCRSKAIAAAIVTRTAEQPGDVFDPSYLRSIGPADADKAGEWSAEIAALRAERAVIAQRIAALQHAIDRTARA
jgi:hypothetical protein